MKPAHKDTVNPPGQIVNEIPRSMTIGGIIDRVRRSEAPAIPTDRYDEGYAAGFIDGKAQGFKEALEWMKGK